MQVQENEDKLLAYLSVGAAYDSQAIPYKNKLTFIAKTDHAPQAVILDEDMKANSFGNFEDRVMSVNHSPSGHQSVIGMDFKGNEKQQFYLIKESDRKVEALIEEPAYFHHFGGWSPDGSKIAFTSNRRQAGYFDLFTVDIATKEVRTVFTYDGICKPIRWLPDGENIMINIPATNIDQTIYIVNIHSGKATRIGIEDQLARYQSIELTKDGSGGYLVTDLGAETMYISHFTFHRPDHFEKLIHFPDWDIEEIKLSPDESTLLFTANEGGISRLYHLDLTSNTKTFVKGLPDGVVQSLDWMDDDRCIFTLKTPTMPGDIWSLTLSEEKINRLTYYGDSELVGSLWVEPEIHTFTSFDGLTVPYFYYEKGQEPNKPAVVYVHGGPENQTRADYNPVIQYLVNQGFAVAAPNVRGSRGYGRTYIKLDDVRKRMDSVEDLSWLVKDLTESGKVNQNKVGIMGRSYGGFMVLAAVTHFPDLWAAGVDIVGISHFKTFLENTGPWRRRLRECEYGTLEEDATFFEEISPLNYSHKITAPLLVFHGRNDTRVPVSEAEQLVEDMQKRDQTVELVIFENEGHQTTKLDNHITMNRNIATFMKAHL